MHTQGITWRMHTPMHECSASDLETFCFWLSTVSFEGAGRDFMTVGHVAAPAVGCKEERVVGRQLQAACLKDEGSNF